MNPDFQALQHQFAAYIRDPSRAILPEGCDPGRMRQYHQLFFNNLDGVLENTFVRFKAGLAPGQWAILTQAFFRNTPQYSPFLADVPARFTDFLAEQEDLALTPGQEELAAFELAAFELRSAEDLDLPTGLDPVGDLRAGHPIVNPECLLFESDFPVHDKNWSPTTEAAAQPTFLCLLRDPEGLIQTQVLSAASALLLALIDENPEASGTEIITQLCRQLDLPVEETRHTAQAQLETWHADRIILGASPLAEARSSERKTPNI